jgi:hypothetical protein
VLLRSKIHKIVIGAMLVLFLYNSFGYLFIYFPSSLIIKHFVHKSINEKKIDPKDLVVLSFSINDLYNNKYDFIWEKPGKEFRINGKMYDIEDKRVTKDSVHYQVYYDHKENILEELFSLQQKENKKDSTHNSINKVVFVGLYYEQIKLHQLYYNDLISSNIPLNKNEAGFLNYISDIPTPPPRIIV